MPDVEVFNQIETWKRPILFQADPIEILENKTKKKISIWVRKKKETYRNFGTEPRFYKVSLV